MKNKKLFLLALNCPLIALPFVAISCGNNGSSNKPVKPNNPSNPTNQAKNKYQKLEDAFATIESIDPSIKDICAMNADENTFKLIKLKASEGTVNINQWSDSYPTNTSRELSYTIEIDGKTSKPKWIEIKGFKSTREHLNSLTANISAKLKNNHQPSEYFASDITAFNVDWENIPNDVNFHNEYSIYDNQEGSLTLFYRIRHASVDFSDFKSFKITGFKTKSAATNQADLDNTVISEIKAKNNKDISKYTADQFYDYQEFEIKLSNPNATYTHVALTRDNEKGKLIFVYSVGINGNQSKTKVYKLSGFLLPSELEKITKELKDSLTLTLSNNKKVSEVVTSDVKEDEIIITAPDGTKAENINIRTNEPILATINLEFDIYSSKLDQKINMTYDWKGFKAIMPKDVVAKAICENFNIPVILDETYASSLNKNQVYPQAILNAGNFFGSIQAEVVEVVPNDSKGELLIKYKVTLKYDDEDFISDIKEYTLSGFKTK